MDNVIASRLGQIVSATHNENLRGRIGDNIDRGLILRRLLEEAGYYIVPIGNEEAEDAEFIAKHLSHLAAVRVREYMLPLTNMLLNFELIEDIARIIQNICFPPTEAEIEKFIQEFEEGKHPLTPEQEKALAEGWTKLLAKIRALPVKQERIVGRLREAPPMPHILQGGGRR